MANKKLILNYGYADYGQIFWDQDGKIITGIHENEGHFRNMSDLLIHFNIKVKHHSKIPAAVKKQSMNQGYGVWEEED